MFPNQSYFSNTHTILTDLGHAVSQCGQDVDSPPKMDEPSALQAFLAVSPWVLTRLLGFHRRGNRAPLKGLGLQSFKNTYCTSMYRLKMPGVWVVCWWLTDMLDRQMNMLNQRSRLIHPKRRLEEVGRCWEWVACCYHSSIILIFLSWRPLVFPLPIWHAS